MSEKNKWRNLLLCHGDVETKTVNPIFMHFSEFNTKTLSQQAGLLCREGVYLSERSNGDFLVALYGLFDFYAEVYHHRPGNELVMISAFGGVSLLEPYLAKIHLPRFLQPAFSA